jgi:hypothetical protein
MATERALVIVAFAGACGSPPASDQGLADSSTTVLETSTDTGDDTCPELIWSDPSRNPEFAELAIASMEQANTLPPYTRIDGTLLILAVSGMADLGFLSCLREVRGGIAIADNPDLETLDGLQRLSELNSPLIENATFRIAGNANLHDLEGLSGLEALPRLQIVENPLLETVNGLANLRTADIIQIHRNEILPTVALPSLEYVRLLEIGEHLCPSWDPAVDPTPAPYANGNPGLVDLDGLASLQSYDDLILKGNVSLGSIDGIVGTSGNYNRVELNEALPYASVVQLSGSLHSCGNLDEPEPCECELHPPD